MCCYEAARLCSPFHRTRVLRVYVPSSQAIYDMGDEDDGRYPPLRAKKRK